MAKKVLMTGNEAAGEAAVHAGCQAYYGYPITPQNELTEYMAARMPQVGRVFIQAESELAAINMCYGSSAAGARTMTSSSSPGISLKQEGISYLAACELPCVIVNVQRGGPGLGNIAPGQADYWQATRGGGHGDYRTIVLAPHTVQEVFELVALAFDLADKYRTPVLVLSDGRLGQMLEPVVLPELPPPAIPPKPWALTGCKGREPNVIRSLLLDENELEALNRRLFARYAEIERREVRYAEYEVEDAEVVLVAYGTSARICREAMRRAKGKGWKVGLVRPITLWPYPAQALQRAAEHCNFFVCVEMSYGQMVEDVRLSVEGRRPVLFTGRTGGNVPSSDEILATIEVGLRKCG